jgi:hypothetical protein
LYGARKSVKSNLRCRILGKPGKSIKNILRRKEDKMVRYFIILLELIGASAIIFMAQIKNPRATKMLWCNINAKRSMP